MNKYLKYGLVIIITLIAFKIFDWFTDQTDELIHDKSELIHKIEQLKSEWKISELKREVLEKENKLKDILIKAYETENDSIIAEIQNASINHDFARIDSIGATLIHTLRGKRQH